jgi:hypothetical protein
MVNFPSVIGKPRYVSGKLSSLYIVKEICHPSLLLGRGNHNYNLTLEEVYLLHMTLNQMEQPKKYAAPPFHRTLHTGSSKHSSNSIWHEVK